MKSKKTKKELLEEEYPEIEYRPPCDSIDSDGKDWYVFDWP